MTREELRGIIFAALASADYLPGSLLDKADRISCDVMNGLEPRLAEIRAENARCRRDAEVRTEEATQLRKRLYAIIGK